MDERTDRALGGWAETQRKALKNYKLKPDRKACLDAIGFRFNPRTEQWNEHCGGMVVKYGKCSTRRKKKKVATRTLVVQKKMTKKKVVK